MAATPSSGMPAVPIFSYNCVELQPSSKEYQDNPLSECLYLTENLYIVFEVNISPGLIKVAGNSK